MRKVVEVEEAKAVMTEALSWSVLKWLGEKKRVRRIADRANAELDAVEKHVKALWSDDLRQAYQDLDDKKNPQGNDSRLARMAKAIREADERAHRAHVEAETIFDEAEEKLSTRLAREGCEKAIRSWELHEKAISKAEAALTGGS